MAVEINATPGDPDANSYADEAYAANYASGRLHLGSWVSLASPLTDPERIALVEATREVDGFAASRGMYYRGERETAEQALEFPRSGLPVELSGVPRRVKDATVELAIQIISAGYDLAGPDPDQGVIRKKVDVIETEWEKTGTRVTGVDRFPRVAALLAPLLTDGAPVPVEVQASAGRALGSRSVAHTVHF